MVARVVERVGGYKEIVPSDCRDPCLAAHNVLTIPHDGRPVCGQPVESQDQ